MPVVLRNDEISFVRVMVRQIPSVFADDSRHFGFFPPPQVAGFFQSAKEIIQH
jgi:hypothetical protein